MKTRVALITGATTGIGLATAERLLNEGTFVILSGREESLSRLSQLDSLKKNPNHWIRPLDIREPSSRAALLNQIESHFGRLDILINNAAVVYRSPIEAAYDFEIKEQMLVNFHAPLELIKCALPVLRKSASAHIINVSSVAGFVVVPTMGLYAASKHALEAASEALSYELSPWNIKVSVVEPGFVASDAFTRMRYGLGMARRGTEPYRLQIAAVGGLMDQARLLSPCTPQDVAKAIVKLLKSPNPPLRKMVTLDARVFSYMKKFLPHRFYNWFVQQTLNSLQNLWIQNRS